MTQKALVVDNDFFFVEFLTELLEQRGYAVVKAYDGKEGISKLEEGPVDIIFVDLIMPKIDGRQFIQFTRKRFPDAHFPIVTHSGSIIEQLDKLKEIGADYFIAKGPLEKMTDQINELLDRIQQQPFPPPPGEGLFEPENIFPRQDTAKLIETLNFHRGINDCIGVGLIVVDRDTKIMSVNSFALDILEESMEGLLNRPVLSIFSKEERAVVIGALKGVAQKPEQKRLFFSATIRSKKILAIVSPLRIYGKISGWIMVLEDLEQWEGQV